jgi:uncharacterized protein
MTSSPRQHPLRESHARDTARSGSQPRLDPRNPFVFDTRELGRRPGTMRRVTRRAPAPAGLGLDLIRVAPGSPIDIDVRLEAVMEGVLVTGTATVELVGECARCLDALERDLEADVQELYAYPDHEIDDDDTEHLVGDLLDLEPVLRDAIVLALPLSPVCEDDCPGLCPQCGVHLAEAEPGHSHEVADPRWARLREIAGDTGPERGARSNPSMQRTGNPTGSEEEQE